MIKLLQREWRYTTIRGGYSLKLNTRINHYLKVKLDPSYTDLSPTRAGEIAWSRDHCRLGIGGHSLAIAKF